MIPLKDINPTVRVPVVTALLIALCVGSWLLWQQEPQRSPSEDLSFNLEYAAIPCELTEGRPLSIGEIEATFGRFGGDGEACRADAETTPAPFPDKGVWLAAIASMFFHGGIMHIAGNMLFLWTFGNNIEDHIGHVRFALFYLAGGIAATVGHVALQPDSTIPVVGASGAVAAVMGAYLVWFPKAPVRTLLLLGFPIIATIRARWLLGFWFVLQFFTAPDSGIAWAAHVAGFVFGAVVAVPVRMSRSAQRAAWSRNHLDDMDPRHWDPTGGVGDVREYRRWRRR